MNRSYNFFAIKLMNIPVEDAITTNFVVLTSIVRRFRLSYDFSDPNCNAMNLLICEFAICEPPFLGSYLSHITR